MEQSVFGWFSLAVTRPVAGCVLKRHRNPQKNLEASTENPLVMICDSFNVQILES